MSKVRAIIPQTPVVDNGYLSFRIEQLERVRSRSFMWGLVTGDFVNGEASMLGMWCNNAAKWAIAVSVTAYVLKYFGLVALIGVKV